MPIDYQFQWYDTVQWCINTAHKCMKHFLIQKYYSNATNFAFEQKIIYKHQKIVMIQYINNQYIKK